MADSSYLIRAAAGLPDMGKGLGIALKAAGIVASDEDLPTECRAPMREAVKAIQYAISKSVQATKIVADTRTRCLTADKKNATEEATHAPQS